MEYGQANFLQSLGWALINSLWQMALLWIIFQVISLSFRSASSSFRSSLASLLLIAGFGWFIYTFISFYLDTYTGQAIIFSSMLNAETNQLPGTWFQWALPVISVVYLVLMILPLARFVRNYRYVQIIRKYGLSKVDVSWRIFTKKVADRMGIKKQVQVWISEFVSSPVTIGFLKPVILVPLAAINQLSPQQMEAVLLHELSHIRRYDYLINLIINFIQTILYFNPFVRAFVKTVERERENSCDEMVLQFQYDSYDYANALLTLEKNNQSYRMLAVGIDGKKNDLLKRVELILGVHKRTSLSFNRFAGLVAGIIFVISLNAAMMIKRPAGEKTTGSFISLVSPFDYLADRIVDIPDKPVPEELSSELNARVISNNITQPETETPENKPGPIVTTPGVMSVVYSPVNEVQLKKYEEAQVKAAIEASRKVLENEEWKNLEINIADVFTQKEKDELKKSYRKELDKIDWSQWENKLRIAYDKVDWNRVNDQLTKAVNNIRIDSLQKVYTEAISKLEKAQQELCQENLPGIPDTDITIKTINDKKQQAQRSLNKLRSVRNKKIVHL